MLRRRIRLLALPVVLALVVVSMLPGVASAAPGDITVSKSAAPIDGCRRYEVTLTVIGEAATGCTDVMLVIDRSGSMNDGGNGCTNPAHTSESSCENNGYVWGPQPFTSVKEAAKGFIDNLDDTCIDYVGVVAYSSTSTLSQGLTDNYSGVQTLIGNLTVNSYGYTNIAAGIADARAELITNGHTGHSQAIIVLSDGVANRAEVGSCSGCPNYGCTSNCCTQDAVYQAQLAKDAGQHVFSIFLNNVSDTSGSCTIPQVQQLGEDTMRAVASGANNFYNTPDADDLEDIYQQIAGQLLPAATDSVAIDQVTSAFTIDAGTLSPAGAIAGNQITWDLGVIGSETVNLTYEITANAGQSGLLAVNDSAVLNYTDFEGTTGQTKNFQPAGSPAVDVPTDVMADAGGDMGFNQDPVPIGGSPTGSGGSDPLAYSWGAMSGDGGLSCTTCTNPNAQGLTMDTEYQVTVTDDDGCVDTDTVLVTFFGPLAVNLAGFSATTEQDAVLIAWETTEEVDSRGFNVHRAASAGGTRGQLNEELIPSAAPPGSPVGANYYWRDRTVEPGVSYYYWLESVDIFGGAELSGPVVLPGAPESAPVSAPPDQLPPVEEAAPAAPPVVPEASTWVLLASGASTLAGYVGLQVRARRRKR